ncbi:MAG: peroxiredoxin, partial [Firmicutes bacterium]|nr:peroxiredoxin [Bacillota bacterium]
TRSFGMMNETNGLAERGTFIINPQGQILAYEVVAGNIGRNSEELLRKVQALQFVAENGDSVCPAKWKPGVKALKPGFDLVGIL